MNEYLHLSLIVGASIACACSSTSDTTREPSGGGTSGSSGGTGGAAGSSGFGGGLAGGNLGAFGGGINIDAGNVNTGGDIIIPPAGPFGDFPATPILDATVPANIDQLFQAAPTAAAPCLVEPESGALFPNNWLMPRFRVTSPGAQNVTRVKLTAADETNPLVVYVSGPGWTMSREMWAALASHVVDKPITIEMQTAVLNGGALSDITAPVTGTFTIAPVVAKGNIVYWSINPPGDMAGTTALKGFQVGADSVNTVLTPDKVQMKVNGGLQATCVGCHTSTPDGKYASFTAQEDTWGNGLASIESGSEGAPPPTTVVGTAGVSTLAQGPLGISTFSLAHWSDTEHVEVTAQGTSTESKLIWIELASGQTGTISRTGDSRAVSSPTWSRDGNTVVYMSTDGQAQGQPEVAPTGSDLFAVPYNNRAGGQAAAIAGAAESNLDEYYPAFSPDDKWLAFNRVPAGTSPYDAAAAELFVVPATGGQATRLAANDPPQCSGKASPGITNSWPKWSPEALSTGGKTYYWLIFSSKRSDMTSIPGSVPQLFVTGVVVPDGGAPVTFPAIYLYNQPTNESNHTPAWDVFKIPPVPIH